MKEKKIKEELELCVRSFIEAEERSKQEGIDEFDKLRILEASFNRLFMSVEHLCNAVMLFEKGNYSSRHFGDIENLRKLKEKYSSDLAEVYQTTYTLRSYADYRKAQHMKDRFTKKELATKINDVHTTLCSCLHVLREKINVDALLQKIDH